MVYVIGGPPRCGKSQLARQLAASHGINFISTDLLWAVLAEALPLWRPPMAKGPDRIPTAAGMFEPYLKRSVAFLSKLRHAAGIEGEVVLPETIARLRSAYEIRVVFLVRPTANPADLIDERGPNPWLHGATADLASAVAAEIVAWSTRVERDCKRLDLPYVDVGNNFDRAMLGAATALGVSGISEPS